jgi:hypothetical protein
MEIIRVVSSPRGAWRVGNDDYSTGEQAQGD